MLVYRTICDLPAADASALAEQLFRQWVAEKHPGLELPETGRANSDIASVGLRRAAEDDGLRCFQGRLEEENPDAIWTTTMSAADFGAERWIWVDVERVSDDPFARPPIPLPPRVVRRFLEQENCFCGEVATTVDVVRVDGDIDALSSELTHPDRKLPLVVLSTRWGEATGEEQEPLDLRAARVAQGLAGIAHVRQLDATGTSRLQDQMGDLAVWGGAIRIYRAGMTEDDASYRHPILPYNRVRNPAQALSAVQPRVGQFAVSRRPPELYTNRIRLLPGFPGGRHEEPDRDLAELLELSERESGLLSKQLDEAVARVGGLEDDLELGRLEFIEQENELRNASARVSFLERRLAQAGDSVYGEATPEDEVPALAEGCEEAVELGKEHLPLVAFCDGCQEAAGRLDANGKASVWGAKAWRTLRAFQRYAEVKRGDRDRCPGGFDYFCEHVDEHPESLSGGWIAMRESETVTANPALSGARTFTVPAEVDPGQRCFMPAHIKIEAGKPPAPRIHFYDDALGASGKVWVGYFGEHLPTTGTN